MTPYKILPEALESALSITKGVSKQLPIYDKPYEVVLPSVGKTMLADIQRHLAHQHAGRYWLAV
jgi:hypothetical protein